ncbi:PaaI family thioesterase [Mangrovimicrobium sediminis]|uniref:PaaI family thioesterase n=1 Tax=Mangrovimicrobium sediminis TaxID=2562682 RepID=UPI001436836E|nr:PaaI family thioesterase [Haliea sp. SAOS-164]
MVTTAPGQWKRKALPGIPASLEALHVRRDEQGFHYAVALDERHVNGQGFIHGGVLVTFLDHALSLLVWEATGRAHCSTVQLDSHFLKALRPPVFVELEGEILRQGRNLAFARGILRVDGESVMEATGTWNVVRATPEGDSE